MKITTLAASNNTKSINKQLALYTANLFQNAEIKILDLNDFELPIFSVERKAENGIPQLAHDFLNKFTNSDLVIISFAEYNGAYTAAFKNIFDWISVINSNIFENLNMLLLSTSPGPRGGQTVLEMAKNRFPHHGAIVKGTFILPSFNQNFNLEAGITNQTLQSELQQIVDSISI
jgi:chromate reductase, NAD(P)H dehydrogenase (quinone)